jgi:multicomponent Na+:H+ antiporter subunit F
MIVTTTIAFAMLALSAVLILARVLGPGSLADRVVGFDTLLVLVVSGIAVHAARTDDGTYLDVLVVTALLGFVGTVTVARFIERRGAR